jgi:hypothetical protein
MHGISPSLAKRPLVTDTVHVNRRVHFKQIAEVLDMINKHTDKVVYLTLEPHLFLFDAYKLIDNHELKGKYTFNNNSESFDFAANALKNLLIENGYKKEGNNVWIK